jgi:hypothetical protein
LLKDDESVISQKNMLQLIRYIASVTGVKVSDEEDMSKVSLRRSWLSARIH